MTQRAAGVMYRPTDIAVDIITNSVYVVEQFNHRVSKWIYTDSQYDFTLDVTWGNNGDGTSGQPGPIGDGGPTDTSFYRPTGIAFDNTNTLLYVTDTFHNRIRTLNSTTGVFETSVGQGGSTLNDFYHPTGIAIDATDATIFIADELNRRVIRYDTGSPPINPTLLDNPTSFKDYIRPHGIFLDVSPTPDVINVADSVRSVVTTYDVTSTSVSDQFGTPGTTGINLFFPSGGTGQLTITSVTSFADTRNSIIKTIENGTTIANTTGTIAGTGNGELYYPESVESYADTVSYVIAANTLNNRVEAYSNDNNTLLTFQSNFGAP